MRNKRNKNKSLRRRNWSTAVLSSVLAMVMVIPANSCPFCSAVALTFTEQMDSSDLVVIACLDSEPEGEDKTQLPRAMFKVSNILKGEEFMKVGQEFKAVVVSRKIKIGDSFLVMGNGTDSINWTTPQLVSRAVVKYLQQLDGLPKKGADRLAFFAGYFEHEESMLAYDAYDEFARAPYADVKALKDRIQPEQLLGWLQDPDVMKSRKRLYYTLLGVCGGKDQLPFLEEVIKSGDRDKQSGLDALIACYLTLTGDAGVPLIEETFLKNPNAEYIDVFSTISALRFHGTESDQLSKPRIVEALRYVLDRPKMADMVIPDLARWEDWSVMERLVKMFKESDTDETRWVRTPIISYLQACPKEEAKTYIEALRKIDPNAAKRADMLAELDWGDDEDEEDDEDESEDESEDDGSKDSGQPKVEAEKSGDDSGDSSSDSAIDNPGDDRLADIDTNQPPQLQSTNPTASAYVSTAGPLPSNGGSPNVSEAPPAATRTPESSAPTSDLMANDQLAQRARPTPPAAMIVPATPATWMLLLGGLGICGILMLLSWSVLNGTFERFIS